MSEPLVLTNSLAQGSSFHKGKFSPVLTSTGLLATKLEVTSTYPGSHDDFYLDINGMLSKARIESMGLDAMLDVKSETVNFILSLNDPLEQLKDELREFGVFIGMKLPPISIRDITWKTVYVAQDIVVGREPDEFDVYESDENAEDDDYQTLLSPHTSSSSSLTSMRNDLGTIADPVTFATADLPLLTTFEDTHGTKERMVIFVNEFFEIRRSTTAGWGAFAVKKLYKGDQILVEKALYHAIHENVTSSVQALPEKERAIANDMFAYHSRDGETLEEAIWSTNSFVSRLPMKPDADGVYKSRLGSQDVAGLFPVASRFNHSCSPKVNFQFRPEHEVLVFTVRDWSIEVGDELTISYGKDPSVLYYKYGFSCECGHCRGFDAMRSEWY
ncbi:SET domain-containing protein [Colletotrichum incanum]|nr:SET domain-containing protein [Colletotrichum incanum]